MKRFDKDQKTTLGKVIIAGVISIIIIIVFSIPLDPSIPPLGDFLFPGDGIWDVPGIIPNKRISLFQIYQVMLQFIVMTGA